MAALRTSQDDALAAWLSEMTRAASTELDASLSEDDILSDLEAETGITEGSPARRSRVAGWRRKPSRKAAGRPVLRPPVPEEQGRAVLLFLVSILGIREAAGQGAG